MNELSNVEIPTWIIAITSIITTITSVAAIILSIITQKKLKSIQYQQNNTGPNFNNTSIKDVGTGIRIDK